MFAERRDRFAGARIEGDQVLPGSEEEARLAAVFPPHETALISAAEVGVMTPEFVAAGGTVINSL